MRGIYGKVVKTLLMLVIDSPRPPASHTAPAPVSPKAPAQATTSSSVPGALPPGKMPNTAETVTELKRRLGKELYRMELDLQGGGRIAGKPCDCLSAKHHFGIEATAEELMSYETNPVYGRVVSWLKQHEKEFEPAEIAKREPDYYRKLTPSVRLFRKEIMGTEKVGALLSKQEKEQVVDKMKKELG